MATPLIPGPSGPHTGHESALARMRRRITESRYFMVSLLVHLIVVIVAGSIVIIRSTMPVEDFIPAGSVPGVEPVSPPTNEPDEKPPELQITAPRPSDAGGTLSPSVLTTAPSPISVSPTPEAGRILRGPGAADLPQVPTSVAIPRINGMPVGIPSAFTGRFPPDKTKTPGITKGAVAAVQRALQWLCDNQNPDGSWGEADRSAMTGLALLCYLGFGELPDSPAYGLTINRAVQWLLENGTQSEGRLGMEKSFSQRGVYQHGIATYALGEYFALTHDGRVKELLAQAVAHIVQGQGPGGGWSYSFDKTADDLSVSGWQIQALKAASLTGLKLPGVDSALDKAAAYVARVRGPKGGYGYRGPEDRYSLSGVGILTLLFWKGERAELRKGMEWLIAETERNHPVKYNGGSADLYAWYYHTQACLMFGGSAWTKWNHWFQDEIINAQSSDGSWPVPGAKGHGPQSDTSRTGAVYRTTLCTLMLEVFYRYSAVHRN